MIATEYMIHLKEFNERRMRLRISYTFFTYIFRYYCLNSLFFIQTIDVKYNVLLDLLFPVFQSTGVNECRYGP